MLELMAPTTARRDELLAAHDEWGPGLHEDGFGIAADDGLETAAGFSSWMDRLHSGPGRLWWIVDGHAVLGGIALRVDNVASIRTIEKCGGHQVAAAELHGVQVHHYLFELG